MSGTSYETLGRPPKSSAGAGRRPRAFDCAIAGHPVKIQARSGKNFLEPGAPYIWCSERDCQYADLNKAPCPLGAHVVFEDFIEAQALVAVLMRKPDRRVCYGCLVEHLGLSHSSLRGVAAHLVNEVGAIITAARCDVCTRRAITIQIPNRLELCAWPREAPPASRAAPLADFGARVLAVRHNSKHEAWCASCVAFAAELSLADARRTIESLSAGGAVSLDPGGSCGRCGRVATVLTG